MTLACAGQEEGVDGEKIQKLCYLFKKNHLKFAKNDSLTFLVSFYGSGYIKKSLWKDLFAEFYGKLLLMVEGSY
jgi:hypothetical protein